MPKYEYFLIEKTHLSVVVEAEDRDLADEQAYQIMSGMDWSMGDMETYYEFNGEIKDGEQRNVL
jgi:hypothetical protein